MRRLKKNVFLGSFAMYVGFLTLLRTCHPEVVRSDQPVPQADSLMATDKSDTLSTPVAPSALHKLQSQHPISRKQSKKKLLARKDSFVYHSVRSVQSYRRCFPDLQDVQIVAAQQWGVPPISNRREAESRKTELVYVGANPYFDIDPRMNRSIPYLVPRASVLLQRIGRSFMDSLAVKGLPLHKIIVSSVLRTDEDVRKLRRHNVNATEQSCHRYGTTFDVAYGRYSSLSVSDSIPGRVVRDDTLKWVLSEVLRDFREQGACYIKYEQKQGCFHITVR